MEALNFELFSYPGPTNPGAWVQFTLPQGTWTSVVVFNRIGEEVSTLLEGEYLQPGVYTLSFRGENLPSGKYVVRVQTALGAKTTNVALLR